MRKRLFAGVMGVALLLAPVAFAQQESSKKPPATKSSTSGMSADMREAIEFQRAKDRADARQARLEARHPSVTYSNTNADRSADRSDPNTVRDENAPGAKPPIKKDK